MKEIERATTIPDLTDPATPRDPEGDLTNEVRAEFGRVAVDLGTPDRGQNDDRTDAVDTIANVLHWLQALDLDPSACLEAATRHFEAEIETTEEAAVRILTAAGLDARLHHTGGGVWVAEVRSKDLPGRQIWVTYSEGDDAGPFLVGVYPAPDAEGMFEDLSGPCTEAELVDRVRRGLAEPA